MKIEKARVGQRVRTRSGVTGTIGKIDHTHVTIYDAVGMLPGNYIAAIENVEPVCDPCRFAKGDKVRAIGKSIYWADIEGKTFEVLDPEYHSAEHGDVVRLVGGYLVKPENLVKCDPCAGCQKLDQTRLKAFREGRAAEKEATGNAIDVLRKDRDNWKATAQQHCRNATYWREGLEKLQKEALKEYATWQMSEIAKCYIRVAPERLLLSHEARRVVEYLDIRNGPIDLRGIFEDCDLGQGKLLDALAEAGDAGKIRLVGGKYEIVRD